MKGWFPDEFKSTICRVKFLTIKLESEVKAVQFAASRFDAQRKVLGSIKLKLLFLISDMRSAAMSVESFQARPLVFYESFRFVWIIQVI